jgi:hypothetical protein
MPHHQANIHINCESMEIIQQAYEDFKEGSFSKRYEKYSPILSPYDKKKCGPKFKIQKSASRPIWQVKKLWASTRQVRISFQ